MALSSPESLQRCSHVQTNRSAPRLGFDMRFCFQISTFCVRHKIILTTKCAPNLVRKQYFPVVTLDSRALPLSARESRWPLGRGWPLSAAHSGKQSPPPPRPTSPSPPPGCYLRLAQKPAVWLQVAPPARSQAGGMRNLHGLAPLAEGEQRDLGGEGGARQGGLERGRSGRDPALLGLCLGVHCARRPEAKTSQSAPRWARGGR